MFGLETTNVKLKEEGKTVAKKDSVNRKQTKVESKIKSKGNVEVDLSKFVQTYEKGKKSFDYLALPLDNDGKYTFNFGLNKAMCILEHIKVIEAFVDKYKHLDRDAV